MSQTIEVTSKTVAGRKPNGKYIYKEDTYGVQVFGRRNPLDNCAGEGQRDIVVSKRVNPLDALFNK